MLPSRCAARSRSDPPRRSGDRGKLVSRLRGGQGHIPDPLLGEPDPGVRDREGVGRLGPGQLCAQTSGLRRRLLLQNFRLLLHVGVWLTLPFFGFPRLPVSISSCLRWSASALLPFRSEAGLIYTSVHCFVIECYQISTLPQ
jgi:hypothetical protein